MARPAESCRCAAADLNAFPGNPAGKKHKPEQNIMKELNEKEMSVTLGGGPEGVDPAELARLLAQLSSPEPDPYDAGNGVYRAK